MSDDAYALWLQKYGITPSPDYNTRAAFNAGVTPSENGHLPDTYKLPNHITYSDQSIYAAKKGAPPPGKWVQEGKNWAFYASPTNVKNAGGVDALMQYFQKYEPTSRLILPDAPTPIDDGNPAKSRKLF